MYNLKNTIGFKKVITREEFDTAFNSLVKRGYWTSYPIVADILLAQALTYKEEHTIILDYFLQQPINHRFLKDIKFQEYVNFIRLERNKKFNRKEKVRLRKFISDSYHMNNFKLKRSSSLLDYVVNYVIKDYTN